MIHDGYHPAAAIMVTNLVAVLIVGIFTGPLFQMLLHSWLVDDASGEAATVCCCRAGQTCCERGVAEASGTDSWKADSSPAPKQVPSVNSTQADGTAAVA